VVGKFVGVLGASWLAVRSGIGVVPQGVTWAQLVGVAAVAGIGFTVSLFVSGVAFADPHLQSAAKLGVLAASVLAAVIGVVLVARACRVGPAAS